MRQWLLSRGVPSVLVAALLLMFGPWGAAPPTSSTAPLRLVEREGTRDAGGELVEKLVFLRGTRDTIAALLRLPPEASDSTPVSAIVLIAGRHAGQNAAMVVPPTDGTALLAIDYPVALPEDWSLSAWARSVPRLRRSAEATADAVVDLARYLAGRSEVDGSRMVLVGVSFGVPFAARAGADSIFKGVGLYHGGADLALLLGNGLPIRNPWARDLVAWWGAGYLRNLEPADHVARISPTPVLLINGRQDRVIPLGSVLRLWGTARDPVRRVWLPHAHITSADTALVRELMDSTFSAFPFLRTSR